MPSKIITTEQKDKMVGNYLNGFTAEESTKEFGLHYSCCIRELKKRGIPIKTRHSVDYRKYSLNENVFQIIDTEEKAYWLGFIASDGYVSKDGHFAIRLKASDIKHLEKFRKFIGSSHPIVEYDAKIKNKTYPACGIYMGNSKLLLDLSSYGIIPNKTFSISYPKNISDALKRHFWRGYFDGDGHIGFTIDKIRNKKAKNWHVLLVGTEHIVSDFESFIKEHVFTKTSKKKRNKIRGIFNFGVRGLALPQKVLDLMYDNASVFLDRKYSLYLQCKNEKIIRKNRNDITLENLMRLYQEHGTWNSVAKQLQTSSGGLYNLRKRLELKSPA